MRTVRILWLVAALAGSTCALAGCDEGVEADLRASYKTLDEARDDSVDVVEIVTGSSRIEGESDDPRLVTEAVVVASERGVVTPRLYRNPTGSRL